MKNYVEGFIIAAIGVAAGLGIAWLTWEKPEAFVIEKEVPFETVIEPPQLTNAEYNTLLDSMAPHADNYWNEVCIGDYAPTAGPALKSLCREIEGAYRRNFAALSVLEVMEAKDMIDFGERNEP